MPMPPTPGFPPPGGQERGFNKGGEAVEEVASA